MADDNKPMKYLRYAIGEILLVVIGILIALSINNWNENRKDQRRVKSHLKEIQSELEFDLKEINRIIKEQETSYEASLYLQNFLNNRIIKIDTQKLKLTLLQTGLLTIFNSSNGAFNNLINSGDIQLIKDDTLKRALVNFHNEEDWEKSYLDGPMIHTYEKYLEYVHQVSKPGMIQNYYLKEFLPVFEMSTIFEKSFISPESFLVDWNKIKNDQKFHNIIDQVLTNRVIQNMTYHKWKNQIEELILQIENSI
jgi:hypothetical protein